mgnify:CR=1 FL=1
MEIILSFIAGFAIACIGAYFVVLSVKKSAQEAQTRIEKLQAEEKAERERRLALAHVGLVRV